MLSEDPSAVVMSGEGGGQFGRGGSISGGLHRWIQAGQTCVSGGCVLMDYEEVALRCGLAYEVHERDGKAPSRVNSTRRRWAETRKARKVSSARSIPQTGHEGTRTKARIVERLVGERVHNPWSTIFECLDSALVASPFRPVPAIS